MDRWVLLRLGLTLIVDRVSFSTGFLTGLKKELMVLVVEGGFDGGEKEGGIALLVQVCTRSRRERKKGGERKSFKKILL